MEDREHYERIPPIRILECRTKGATLYLGDFAFASEINSLNPLFSIRDEGGNWVGAIRVPQVYATSCASIQSNKAFQDRRKPIQLVAISRGVIINASSATELLDEWQAEERPKSPGRYEWYNVIWVEWNDGVAYRTAVGRVHKGSWESQPLEWINLVLG
jgi:hypothetical protein